MERCCPMVEEDGVYSVTDYIFHRRLNNISCSTYASYNVTWTLLPLKSGVLCPLSSAPELDKIYSYFNQWQKWYHKMWGTTLSACWNSRLGTLSYHLRSLTTLKLTSCEEAQAVWRGPAEVPANSQNQMPDVGVKTSPEDSSFQSPSLPNWGPRHHGAEISCLCRVLSEFPSHRIWQCNKIIVSPYYVLGWFVTRQ